MTMPRVERTFTFPLTTRWARPEHGNYGTPKIPTIRQIDITCPNDLDDDDVERIASVLRSCLDRKPTDV